MQTTFLILKRTLKQHTQYQNKSHLSNLGQTPLGGNGEASLLLQLWVRTYGQPVK
jgi:hypothetical protein